MNHNFFPILPDKAIIRGGLYLYSYNDAVSLVKICDKRKIKVLGIDAFYIGDGNTHPVMEHSIDFSGERCKQGNERVYEFLKSKQGYNLVFEIVY